MKINKYRIVKWKVYFDRARNYFAYIQFLMTSFIILRLIPDCNVKTIIFNYWYISFPIIFLFFIMICLTIGYIEAMLKIREIEQNNYSEANPFLKEIKTKLNSIEEKLTSNFTQK